MKKVLFTKLTMKSLGLCTILLLGLAPDLRADREITAGIAMPLTVNGVINTTDCNNSPGPRITLDGELSLGGMQMEVILQNNAKGTHKTTVVFSSAVVLIPAGTAISLPKQPVLGGVGGNPHIYLQFHDGNGNALSEEFYLGRCVQGFAISADMLNQVLALANIQVAECRNSPGPVITISGHVALSGMNAKFIFRNNVKGTHTAEVFRDLEIIPDGATIEIPKQPVRGGVGGNPIISIRFLHGDGTPIGDAVTLGRCIKI